MSSEVAISIQELIAGLEAAGKEVGFDALVCVAVSTKEGVDNQNVIDVITDSTLWATIIVAEN